MDNDIKNQEIMFKEIDLTQAIISRMASNSFAIKSWSVTLVAASLLLKGDWIEKDAKDAGR